jgi:methylated-DNA-[protein]-cysteine S-methyltransferase
MSSYVFKSIIGNIELVSSKNRIIAVHRTRKKPNKTENKLLKRSALQIKMYLARKRRSLNFPTNQTGTRFQNRVWNYLRKVPYGKTITYGDIARKLKTSPRAVGGALGRNSLMVSVPCHRVVGTDGKLTGFTSIGGVNTKRKLLSLEKKSR